MSRSQFILLLLFAATLVVLLALSAPGAQAGFSFQEATGDPTETAPASGGAIVFIRHDAEEQQINVRSGPHVDYAAIGVLVVGQQVPALGRTPGGDWIKIDFPGAPGSEAWVYSPLVEVQGELRILEPAPTPTPLTTPTVDPTLAAQFIVDPAPTRLPTFTPPPPLVIPTYVDAGYDPNPSQFPTVYVIIGLFVAGVFGTLISLLRGR
jgi:hypothetical protein